MQRCCSLAGAPWQAKTRTVLRQMEAEACMKKFDKLPPCTVFDPDGEKFAQEIWENSYECEERKGKKWLADTEKLRKIVKDRIYDEVMSVSPAERLLIRDTATTPNAVKSLIMSDEIFAAEALVRRMWASVSFNKKSQQYEIEFPNEIRSSIINCIVTNKEISPMNDLSLEALDIVSSILYAQGAADMDYVIDCINRNVNVASKKAVQDYPIYLRRLLVSYCDYVKMPEGKTMLFHTGATDTTLMIDNYKKRNLDAFPFDYEMFGDGSEDCYITEVPKLQKLMAALSTDMREGMDLPQCVNDLRFLAKQGVGFEDLQNVMKGMICCTPSRAMLDALRDLCDNTPRWVDMANGVKA